MVASAVVMEHEAALQPWPAARRTGALIVAHPAWEDARNAILDLAAAGPVTVALVGPPGTGKTWLLRELASSLGDHGFPTMVLLQGDLPSVLAGGAALLIDEALRMSEPALETLLAQQHGVAVLTDLDRFGDIVAARQSPAAVIRLRPLEDTEMAEFVADWLRQSAVPPMVLDAAALAALIKNSRGAVRLAVQGSDGDGRRPPRAGADTAPNPGLDPKPDQNPAAANGAESRSDRRRHAGRRTGRTDTGRADRGNANHLALASNQPARRCRDHGDCGLCRARLDRRCSVFADGPIHADGACPDGADIGRNGADRDCISSACSEWTGTGRASTAAAGGDCCADARRRERTVTGSRGRA